jgi:hypothetical protein
MDYIVAFADILGTSDRVNSGTFDDSEILDFANPVGIIAEFNPLMQFSVFSDSVFVAARVEELDNFVSVMSFLYSQWFSDAILVRAGISFGELRFVEHSVNDKNFRKLSNLSYARVYGKGLITAHAFEERSGPGAICYIDETASIILKGANDNYVLEGAVDSLIWADLRGINYWLNVFESRMSLEDIHLSKRRHYRATTDYFSRLKLSGKQLPNDFLYHTMEDVAYDDAR